MFVANFQSRDQPEVLWLTSGFVANWKLAACLWLTSGFVENRKLAACLWPSMAWCSTLLVEIRATEKM